MKSYYSTLISIQFRKSFYQQNPFSSDLEEVQVAIPCLHDDEDHLQVGVQLALPSHDIL